MLMTPSWTSLRVEDARQQERANLEHGGADGMALLAEQIPEHDREFIGFIFEADVLGALDERFPGLAGRCDPGEVALDVGGEHRHAGAGKAFRDGLQRHRLAGPGGAGHEPMAIAEGERQHFGLVALADEYFSVQVGISHRDQPSCAPVSAERSRRTQSAIIGPHCKRRERIWQIGCHWAAIRRRFDPLDIASDDTSVVSLQQL